MSFTVWRKMFRIIKLPADCEIWSQCYIWQEMFWLLTFIARFVMGMGQMQWVSVESAELGEAVQGCLWNLSCQISFKLAIFIIANDLVWALQIRVVEDLIEYFGWDELYHPPSIVLTLLPPFWYLKNGVGSKHFGSDEEVKSAVNHGCRKSW